MWTTGCRPISRGRPSPGGCFIENLDYILGGPLSQFYHAFLFKVCGVSIHALVVSSLVVAAGLVVVTYEAFRRAADTLTATAIGLVIILGFAFAQYVANGNYNYICPYTSESVHGLALSILCLALLSIWLVKGRAALAGLAGLAFGLVFLTKPEVFLALAAAAAGAWLLAFALRRQFRPFFLGKSAIAFAFGAGLPVWAFFLRFWSAGTTGDAARAVAGAWMPVLAGGAANNAFHRWCIGLDHPAHNAAVTLGWFFGYLAVILILVGFGRAMARRRTLDEQIFLCLIPLGLLAGATAVNWVDCGWVLPPATTAITLHLAWAWWNRGEPARDGRLFLPLLWSVFAFFLLLKIFLHSRIWHYGFYLAMPAMVINVFYLAWWLPHRLGPGRLQVGMFRGAVLLLLAVILCGLVRHSAAYYRLKTFPVGRGADRMFAFPSGTGAAWCCARTDGGLAQPEHSLERDPGRASRGDHAQLPHPPAQSHPLREPAPAGVSRSWGGQDPGRLPGPPTGLHRPGSSPERRVWLRVLRTGPRLRRAHHGLDPPKLPERLAPGRGTAPDQPLRREGPPAERHHTTAPAAALSGTRAPPAERSCR